MNLLIVGAGVVGFATGSGLERYGHDVIFYDIDEGRRKWLRERNYNVIDDYGELKPVFDIIFVCTREEHVENALSELTEYPIIPGFVTIRSTINPGQTEELEQKFGIHLCHNPEFLTEKAAIWEFLRPNFILLGECCRHHGDLLENLYKPFGAPIYRVDHTTSEMTKLTFNAYFYSTINFWNQIHQICKKIKVNSHVVGRIASSDPRITTYGAVQHGRPVISRCLNKDLDHLIEFTVALGYNPSLLKTIRRINENIAAEQGVDVKEALKELDYLRRKERIM